MVKKITSLPSTLPQPPIQPEGNPSSILKTATAAPNGSGRKPPAEGEKSTPASSPYVERVMAVRKRLQERDAPAPTLASQPSPPGSSPGHAIQSPDCGTSSPPEARADAPEYWRALQSDVMALARHLRGAIGSARNGKTFDPPRATLKRLNELGQQLEEFADEAAALKLEADLAKKLGQKPGDLAERSSAGIPKHGQQGLEQQQELEQRQQAFEHRRPTLLRNTLDLALEVGEAAVKSPLAERTRLSALCGKVILRALAIARVALLTPLAIVASIAGFAAGQFTTPIYLCYEDDKRKKMLAEGKAEKDLPPKLKWWLALPLASNVFGAGMAWHFAWSPIDSWLESHERSMEERLEARQHVLELQAWAGDFASKLAAKLDEANPGHPVTVTLEESPTAGTTTVTHETLEGREIEVLEI